MLDTGSWNILQLFSDSCHLHQFQPTGNISWHDLFTKNNSSISGNWSTCTWLVHSHEYIVFEICSVSPLLNRSQQPSFLWNATKTKCTFIQNLFPWKKWMVVQFEMKDCISRTSWTSSRTREDTFAVYKLWIIKFLSALIYESKLKCTNQLFPFQLSTKFLSFKQTYF